MIIELFIDKKKVELDWLLNDFFGLGFDDEEVDNSEDLVESEIYVVE